MAARRREPRWVPRVVLDAVHTDQLREHGGLPGIRDENALESALARPLQKWQYGAEPDIPSLAAAYAFGFVRNHAYVDGNKRIGFLAMVIFLETNGYAFDATDAEVVVTILGLAAGDISEDALAAWIREHSTHIARSR